MKRAKDPAVNRRMQNQVSANRRSTMSKTAAHRIPGSGSIWIFSANYAEVLCALCGESLQRADSCQVYFNVLESRLFLSQPKPLILIWGPTSCHESAACAGRFRAFSTVFRAEHSA